jgi:regulator of cell morphogenesis and NO signaling
VRNIWGLVTGTILRQFGIDRERAAADSIESACQLVGVRVSEVLHSLGQAASQPPDEHLTEWHDASLESLMALIVKKHHAYCREELSRLELVMNNVVRKHGDRRQELRRVQSVFLKMGNDLKQHLLKEEQTLFPMIARMEAARSRQAALPKFPFGTIANPIRMMLLEHDTGERELEEIRKLTYDLQDPSDVDDDHRELLRGLNDFAQDMKRHVFLENERLFPRAIALEQGDIAQTSVQP